MGMNPPTRGHGLDSSLLENGQGLIASRDLIPHCSAQNIFPHQADDGLVRSSRSCQTLSTFISRGESPQALGHSGEPFESGSVVVAVRAPPLRFTQKTNYKEKRNSRGEMGLNHRPPGPEKEVQKSTFRWIRCRLRAKPLLLTLPILHPMVHPKLSDLRSREQMRQISLEKSIEKTWRLTG